ncbi:peroxiredoxin-like family protein [Niallia sp. 03133]|uniref:peroxiredoxin-like family protein n=1 Tax=Niallia sp. 03133 TaxID=3458060 RepID=UPI0040448B80
MSTLLEEINDYKASFRKKASPEKQRLMEQATKELASLDIAKGLKIDALAPNFTLKDATGNEVALYEELTKGPVILTFYRGAWCPYCNLELKAYQRVLSDIKETGAQLIAISPQTPDASLTMKEKNELSFFVLSDPNGSTADDYKLLFKMPDYLIEIYQQSGLDVPAHNGNDAWELPVPATYIINQSGIIQFANVDPDYRNRVEPAEIVALLKKLA